jgi:hypothetical protein
MQAGNLVSSDVSAFTSRVLVNGVERAHEFWSINREIVGDLPEQVVGGSGIKQATGAIVWKEQPDVSETAPNPWNAGAGWLPKAGERVVIRVSDGVTEWPQFVGVIDEASGDVGGSVGSTIIDYMDWLNTPFNHSTVLRLHPPKTEGAEYMGVGLTPAYLIDRLFRRAGFYATPAMEPGVVMSAPLQTSTWPEYGVIVSAGSMSGGNVTHGLNSRAPWGWAMRDFAATYNPQGSISRTDPVQLTCMVAPDHTGSFRVDANYGTAKIRLWINQGRAAVATLDGVEVCRMSMGAGAVVTLLVKNGVWTLKNDVGNTTTGSRSFPAGDAMTTVQIGGDANSRIAGVQVAKPTTMSEFQSVNYTPSAYLDSSTLLGIQDAMPSIVNRTVAEVLDEVSKATLSPFWFNESGKLVMYGSDVLRRQAPVRTVTTLDDITKLSWTDSRLGVRSSVTVKYRYPAINRSRYANVLLWQGSGETMVSGQEKEMFAKESGDEDWAAIDDFTVSNEGGNAAFNEGRGSWVATHLEDSKGGFSSSAGYATWSPIRSIDDETRLFKVVVGTLPAGTKLVLATPEDAVNYHPRMRGLNMPVLRGRARVKWADMTLTSAITGPIGFPALEHDCGPYSVQTDNTIIQQRSADFIASQVSTPQPVIDTLSITYDPRLQLGDVITISSPTLMGVELRALIVGKNERADGGSFSQSLSVRIISGKSTFITYDELAAAWAGGNYASLQTAWAALNYGAMASNPLEVTP